MSVECRPSCRPQPPPPPKPPLSCRTLRWIHARAHERTKERAPLLQQKQLWSNNMEGPRSVCHIAAVLFSGRSADGGFIVSFLCVQRAAGFFVITHHTQREGPGAKSSENEMAKNPPEKLCYPAARRAFLAQANVFLPVRAEDDHLSRNNTASSSC